MRKLNVLFMQSQGFFGADSMIHSLLMRYLDRNTLEVHAACNQGSSEYPSASLKVLSSVPHLHVLPTHFGISINGITTSELVRKAVPGIAVGAISLGRLLSYARKQRIDIVHCTEKPRDAFYGLLLARAVGARCVIHVHVKAENWISPLVRWSMKQADALVGVSDFVSGSIVDLGYPAAKTYTLLNSLDLSRWNNQADGGVDTHGWNDHDDGSTIRAEFGLPADMPVLGIISRVCPWKGHGDLLKALALVKTQVPCFRLLLVGEDDPRATPGGGSYTAELRALSAELGLTEHIIYTGYRRDVPQLMAACDIYAMPSFEEPFGVVYLEAMAMRKPIIALDNGGAREIVEHGLSGLLSLPQDIEHLAENIVTLLKDAELRQRMGAYGRKVVEDRFSPQQMARNAEQIYRRTLGMSHNEPIDQGGAVSLERA